MSEKIAKGKAIDQNINGTPFRLVVHNLHAADQFAHGDAVVIIPEADYDALLKESQLWRNTMATFGKMHSSAMKALEEAEAYAESQVLDDEEDKPDGEPL